MGILEDRAMEYRRRIPLPLWSSPLKPVSGLLPIAFLVMFLAGCAAFKGPPAGPPMGERQMEEALSRLQEQDGKVSSFYTRGNLFMRNWYGEEQSGIVIAGSKDPFRIKIEVTHGWGQPILHILIDQGKLEVLSFQDSTLYVGDFTPEALSRFLPGPLSPDLIWSALRGYPTVSPHSKVLSPGPERIDLYGAGNEKVETIQLGPETMHPERVLLPPQQVALMFSDFVESEGIFYAREVEVDHRKSRGKLLLKNEKMVFNRPVPDEVFTIDKPPGFTVSSLEEK
ncbi:MAG: hypothetical protein CVU64_05415 [Deltaproteobacteria bacterium HGW-Deltaproteobacteria-21]|nr:MAG: hypothetical protein CVU64_05415 [Deltaproteobacteria bacterium HGW-Deltaproteobacteria-21]